MKVGTILTATDLNPLYCDFIPIFVEAWNKLVPEADICIVMIANDIPERLRSYSNYIKLVSPIDGIHTGFQAQCIRLLYPRIIQRNEGVLITDMDMIPLSRKYYVDSVANLPENAFVLYRDDCLPHQIAMCYNIATPSIWKEVFGTNDTAEELKAWYEGTGYDGIPGGPGWGTDQGILVHKFNNWNGHKIILNDRMTDFHRLDRLYHADFFSSENRTNLASIIGMEHYADFHCFRPYADYKEQNDFVVYSIRDYRT
jgi:hypothetical protein